MSWRHRAGFAKKVPSTLLYRAPTCSFAPQVGGTMLLGTRATRFIPLSLGAGIFLWSLWYLTNPGSFIEPFLFQGDRPPPPPPSQGSPIPADTSSHPPHPPTLWASRANQVKSAFLHAYHGYQQYAFENDELLPLTNHSVNKCAFCSSSPHHTDASLLASMDGDLHSLMLWIPCGSWTSTLNLLKQFLSLPT